MTYPPHQPQQPYPPRPYGQYAPPPPPPRKKRWPLVVAIVCGVPIALFILGSVGRALDSDNEDDKPAVAAPAATAPGPAAPAPAGGAPAPAPAPAGPTAPSGPLQHPEDVQVTGCIRDNATGWPKALLTITNHSSKASTYSIRVSFQSQDGKTQYDEGYTYVASLAPGQASPQTAAGLRDIPADAALACVVTSAQRTAA